MNQEEFEKLIISFAQGDSSPNFTEVIDQMLHQEENIYDFTNSLFELLFISKNETAQKSAMVLISFILSEKWSSDIFDENWIDEIFKNLISYYDKNEFIIHSKSGNSNDQSIETNVEIDNDKIYLLSQLVSIISKNISQYFIFDKFIHHLDNKDELSPKENLQYLKDLTFQISSLYSLYTNINLSKIEAYYDIVIDILRRALESHSQNFANAIKAIYILSVLLDFFPDEKEVLKSHVDIIISLANDSDSLPPDLFLDLWKSICSLLYSTAASNDESFVALFHPSVFKICAIDTISSDFKLYPLMSIWSCACDYDRPIIHQICNLTCEIASQYVNQSNSLPFDFLFIFETCFHDFDHDMVYQYTHQLIVAFLNSEEYSDHIVGLCLLRYMVLNLPHEVFHDTDFIINEVEKGLQSDDDLMIEVSSIIISSCSIAISSNLIDVDSLIPQFIPFLIHPNPDVRYYATEACETLLSILKPQISIPGISLMVFNLVTKIIMEDIPRYLKLLSKCIRHDFKLGTELAVHFANFTYSMMTVDTESGEFNKAMIEGSLYVSIALMSMDENTHEILLPQTIEVIEILMQSEDQIEKNFGINMLNKLMKIFPNESSEIFNNYAGLIEEVLDSDDDSLDRRKAVINISSIVSLSNDENHPFIPKIVEIAKNWINSDHHSLIGCGIEALKKLQCHPILAKEMIVEIFQCMAQVVTETKSFDIACSCANAMAYCVRHCTRYSDAHDEIANIGYQIGLTYIKGEMLILQGVSPVGTDLEFNLIYSMSMLVSELFSTPCDIMRFFFPFIESIIYRNNNLNTEVMMMCLVSALKNDALIDEEVEKTKNFMFSLFIEEIPKELMCTEVELIEIMLDKGILEPDEFDDNKLNILQRWWEICNDQKERTKLKATSAEIVLLLWKLEFNYQIRNKIEDLVILSFKQFPPEVISFTPEMIKLAQKCVDIVNDAPEIIFLKLTKGLLKLMSLPKMNLKKRGVDDDLFNVCKNMLSFCLKKTEKAKLMLNEFANKSESRKIIFNEFII